MSKWAEYYRNRIGKEYTEYCKERYKDFIKEICTLNEIAFIKEEGCGIGTFSKILLLKGFKNLMASDKDLDMLNLMCKNLEILFHEGLNIDIFEQNVLYDSDLKIKHDTIFSHGLLEHFSDKDIHTILNRQKSQARKVIHYVPTNGYSKPSFGDERLMPISWWIYNFRPNRWIVSNSGKDLTLIWEDEDT